MSVWRFMCGGRGWSLLLVYVVRHWGMSCVIVFENGRYTASTQVFAVLYVLHINALKDVVYLCDKPNNPYQCAHLCLSNKM
jgi:hypothetical protein